MVYKAAIVGCGRIGCLFDDTHARAYLEARGVRLVGLCDNDREQLAAAVEMFPVPSWKGYPQMMQDISPDIVSVCTPPETHERIVCDLARTGVKAIWCEKPIATSVAAAMHMGQVCADRGVLLIINHQRRFSFFHQWVARHVQQGGLGVMQQVTCYYGAGVTNTGSHLFDLLRFYLGEATAVRGWYSVNSAHIVHDCNIDGVISFDRGVRAFVQACNAEYAIFEVVLLGTKGRLRITQSGYNAEYETVVDHPLFTGYKDLKAARLPVGPDDGWLQRGALHIVDCLNYGYEPISTGEDGLAALEIIEALKLSAEYGGKLCLL